MQPAIAHHYIDLQGTGTIHYLTAGQGPPLLMVHGLAASVVTWHENFHPLSRYFTLYAPDLPGHGDSARPKLEYTLETGTRFLLTFLDALGLHQGVSLMGNSLGGLLCLATAMQTPSRFRALVLVAPVGLGREVAWQLRVAASPIIGRPLYYLTGMRPVTFLGQVVRHPERVDPIVLQEMRRVRKVPGTLRTELGILRSGVAMDGVRPSFTLLQYGTGQFPVPTLLVWGEEDRILPVAIARRTAQRTPETRVLILPDCGHWPQMEKPEIVNEAVLAFLGHVPLQPLESAAQ